eukprot:gene6773-10937_t
MIKFFVVICAFSEHKDHKLISIEEASNTAKQILVNIDFESINDETRKKIKVIDDEMMESNKNYLYQEKNLLEKLKKLKKEYHEKIDKLDKRKILEQNSLETILDVSNNIEYEENHDTIIKWRQLGLGDSDCRLLPTEFLFFDLKLELRLFCGGNFTFAIYDKRVFCWGANENGQLGLGYLKDRLISTELKFFNFLNVKELYCGSFHCFALTENGSIFTWGYNDCGQIGSGDFNDHDVPVESSKKKF